MKKQFKPLTGLLIAMSVGFALDLILWMAYTRYIVPIWFAIGFGLCYLHFRWLKGVNKDKDDVKIKHLI